MTHAAKERSYKITIQIKAQEISSWVSKSDGSLPDLVGLDESGGEEVSNALTDHLEGLFTSLSESLEIDREMASFHNQMRIKYEHARKWPWAAMPIEPPRPYAIERSRCSVQIEDYGGAISVCEEALRFDSENAEIHNRLARIWAACPKAGFRNGKRAVDSATRACELSRWKNAAHLDTLAAAYAEIGDFESALRWQRKALAVVSRKEYDMKGLTDHLRLYEAAKPLRDKPKQ